MSTSASTSGSDSRAASNPMTNVVALKLRATGPLDALDAPTLSAVSSRGAGNDVSAQLRENTAGLIELVRQHGDSALREMANQFDGVELASLEVPRTAWTAALDALSPDLRAALQRAARNIGAVHKAFMPVAVELSPEPGIVVGRRPDALLRVGVYAPGGRAAYPSSLLMGAVPARIAGVREIIVCSPPGPTGLPSPVVLAAAALAGVDRVFAIGGAGAIAAMAFGTESVPRVDRIVGPGNAYVAEAKLQLMSRVGIDAPAGPSELLVLADDSADARVIARELVAQAEHDPDAAVVAVIAGSDAAHLAADVIALLASETGATPRAMIVRQSLAARGAVLTTPTIETAIAFANDWAAEHLLLLVDASRQDAVARELRSAGAVFIGASSSVAFGDYMTGANHVLPTAGAARSYSGLSTADFVRWTSWQRVSADAAASLAKDVACFAEAEGLPAHAMAARAWATSTAP